MVKLTRSYSLLFASVCACMAFPAERADAQSANESTPRESAIEEIVVTARKRAESLQDVPVAVTALQGEDLERRGIGSTRDLFAVTPGLFLSQSGQRQNDEQFYLTLRGVGASPVVEPSVGIFVDGMYVPSLGWTTDFIDLDRIEILRGPQGALFGRNTEAGALNVITRKPGADSRAALGVEAADFDTYKTRMTLSGALSANWFGGLALFGATTDGYVRNATRGEPQDNRDRYGGRGTFRFSSSEQTDVELAIDYLKSKGRFDAFGDAVASQVVTVVDPQAPAAQRGSFTRVNVLAGPRYTTFGNFENTVDVESYGATLNGSFDLGSISLTSISGYRSVRSEDIYDADQAPNANSTNSALTEQRIVSQELRLASDPASESAWSWLIGVYGFSERLEQDRLSSFVDGIAVGPITGIPGTGFTSDNVRIERKGLAPFGQLSYRLTTRTDLTVGLRYSYEDVEQTPNLRVRVQIPALPPPGVVPTIVDVANTTAKSKSFSGVSPSASLSFHLADDLLLYGSVATGFKGGGFTKEVPNTPLQNAALDNETSINYEIGSKGTFFDNRLRVNGAVFYTEIKDQQLSTRIELAPGTGIFIPSTQNVGKGHSQGVEIEMVAVPATGLTFNASAAYTKTEFDDYVASPATATAPEYNRAGQAFPEIPKWTGSATLEYSFPISASLSLAPQLSYQYIGSRYTGQGNVSIPFVTIDATDLLDLQLSLYGERWRLAAYAHNLTDEYYFVNRFQLQPIFVAPGVAAFGKTGAPRQIGIRLDYEF